MSDLLGDHDPASINVTIRNYFTTRGGSMPVRALAEAMLADEALPREVVEHCTVRGVMSLCRAALKARTDEDLPFAQPVGEGPTATWRQLDLFTEAQAFALIERRSTNLEEDYGELCRLQAWCLEKFRRAPEIPALLIPSIDRG